MSAETPADRARRLLEGATPGPWRYDRYDVVPTRSVSEGWLIADCGTSDSPDAADANVRLISAAPDLARDLIAESEAHEVTRAALAAVERERDEALTDGGLVGHYFDRAVRAELACAALEMERDEARAELAAAQERLTWPRWAHERGEGVLELRLPSFVLLAVVWNAHDDVPSGWRAWHGPVGSGPPCPWEQGAGGIEEAEAYLAERGRIRAGCTIRPAGVSR